jgi:flavin-dependent dehydrogenase
LTEPVSTAPLLFREPQPVQGGVLAAGDAAGFVDPFIGDGISLALRSGALASECLGAFLAGNASLSKAAQLYSEKYEHRFGEVFRTSSGIRRMLGLPAVVRAPILRMLENFPAITRYFVKKTRGAA